MDHNVALISTMAAGLVYALVGGYIASRLRLPPLLGYLLAGIAVGPFTPGFVADAKLAPQLAEIGVILLMFGVGMHFSLRDLLAVRNIAVPGALVQIAVAVAADLRHYPFLGLARSGPVLFWDWRSRSPARSFCCVPWKRKEFWSRRAAGLRWAG